MLKPIFLAGQPCSAFTQRSVIVAEVGSEAGIFAQQVEYRYGQNISRLYVVGCPDVWIFAGRTFGESTLLQPTGPYAVAKSFCMSLGHAKIGRGINCESPIGTGPSSYRVSLDRCSLVAIQGPMLEHGILTAASASVIFLGISLPTQSTTGACTRLISPRISAAPQGEDRHPTVPKSRAAADSVWTQEKSDCKPPPSLRSLEIPVEYRRNRLVARQLYLALPKPFLPMLAKAFGEAAFDPSLKELDVAISRVCEDNSLCVGFDRGAPIIYPLLRRRTLKDLPLDAQSLANAGWNIKPEQTDFILNLADVRSKRAFEVAKGFAGWLMTDRIFIQEQDALIGQLPTEGATSDAHTERLQDFCGRWQLSALAAPYLPVPLMTHTPLIGSQLPMSSLRGATSTISWPCICPPPSRDEVRNMIEECSRGSDFPEHLAGWMRIVSSANSAKNQITRYARIFEVQHFCRILGERYPSVLERGQHKLEIALAEFLHVSTATIRADLRLIRRRLGGDWMRRGNAVMESACNTRAAPR